MRKINIAITGTGYVGLVAGACLAKLGHRVTCVDIDAKRIAKLNKAEMPIYELGLEALVKECVAAGRLKFTTSISDAGSCEAAFIAVGTPPRAVDGAADLTYVFESARQLAEVLPPGAVIIDKSTVPVGTGDVVERIVRKTRPGTPIYVASCPEFLREGSAIDDFMKPDRIIIGVNEKEAEDILRAIFEPLAKLGYPLITTKRRSAELIKYAANAFLATKLTFINEIADLCEVVDADIDDVALGMGSDSRIGPKFLQAGPGYGGSCFPKDTLALLRTAQEHGVGLRIVDEGITANRARKRRMMQKVSHIMRNDLEGAKIAILGLTFKADTDDMRDSPSIPMIELLQRAGAEIHAFDPQGTEQAKLLFEDVSYYSDPYQCATNADVVVIMTEWNVIKQLDLKKLASVMKTPLMVDLRRVFRPEEAEKHGFTIETVGRMLHPPVSHSGFPHTMTMPPPVATATQPAKGRNNRGSNARRQPG